MGRKAKDGKPALKSLNLTATLIDKIALIVRINRDKDGHPKTIAEYVEAKMTVLVEVDFRQAMKVMGGDNGAAA